MSLFLAVLAQIGPFANQPAAPPLRPPTNGRHGVEPAAAPARPAPQTRLEYCLDQATSSPVDAIGDAETWRDAVSGMAKTEPGLCLGSAHARLEHWSEAEQAFLAGRDADTSAEDNLRTFALAEAAYDAAAIKAAVRPRTG